MTKFDMLVVAVGLGVGYWVVGRLMSGSGTPRDPPPAPPRPAAPPAASAPPAALPGGGEGVTLTNWYRILGVAETASAADITAAYHRRLSEVAPDAAGAAKTRQLNAAYAFGMRRYR